MSYADKIKPLSVYIHWPYCKSKCPYCDFFKRVNPNVNQEEIVAAYIKELDYYHNLVPNRAIRSVFFGGGTPSLLKPELINKLLNHIAKLWSFEDNPEISLEANPNSEYPEMFARLKQAGINRLSLGIQALNDTDLHFLGRTHNLKQALHSIDEVLNIFNNHSADFIYTRPEQTLKDWEQELGLITGFRFKHLSLYQLTIEEGTVFAAKHVKIPDEESAANMYNFTVNILRETGYPRYEVSNFAAEQYQSKHNKCYWLGDDYIGIGESAHGRLKIGNCHYAFVHPRLKTALSAQERAEELIIMGLRLQTGINKKHFAQISGLNFDDFVNNRALNEFVQNGLLINTAENISATDKGFMLLNYIIGELCS